MIRRVLTGALFAFLLASCAPSGAELALQDDRQCLSYGAKQGSDGYVSCRSQLAAARSTAAATAAAIDDAIGTAAMAADSAARRARY